MKCDDPVCPACAKAIEPGMPVSTPHGELLHRWCYDAPPSVQAMKLGTPPKRGADKSG